MAESSALAERIASLPPDRRRLLEKMARPRSAASQTTVVADQPVISATQFSVELGTTPPTSEVGRFYDAINGQLDATILGEYAIFLNYGYMANDSPQEARIPRLPDNMMNRNAVQLVLELVGRTPIEPEDDVLDVGCGRGGTITTLRRHFGPGRLVGIDLSPRAIAFCSTVHVDARTVFTVGNAEQLPFVDGSFNVVTNIESSHTYNDIKAFYAETFRVLRPDGWFLYTDLMATEGIETNLAMLGELGYTRTRQQDITSNVLLSCDDVAATHARAFAGSNDQEILQNFLAVPGSRVYDEMKLGKTRYMLFNFRKGAQ